MFERVIEFFKKGDSNQALAELSRLDVRNADMNKVNFLYANIYLQKKSYSLALRHLLNCLNGQMASEELFRLIEVAQRRSKETLKFNVFKTTLKFLASSNESINYLTQSLTASNQSTFAIEILDLVLTEQPRNLHTLKLKSTLLGKKEPSWEAAQTLETIIDLEPSAEAYSNYGSVLFRLGEIGDALRNYVRSIRLNPMYEVAYYNLGNLLKDQLKYSWAIKCYEKSLKLGRSKASVYNNLGNTLVEKGEYDKAEEFLKQVLAERPDVTEIRYNLGLMYLRRGNYEEGWKLFDLRWQVGSDKLNILKRNYTRPKWDGDPNTEGTLLIWREQGVGDEIQISGMIRGLRHKFKKVIIEYDPRLVTLMQRSFPTYEVRPDKATGNEDYFDYHLPIADIPAILRANRKWQLEAPFLKVDTSVVANIAKELRKKAGGRLILGLSWRSGNQTKYRNLYYTKLNFWEKILKMENVFAVNLQYGDISLDLEEVDSSVKENLFIPNINLKDDFDNVTALIKATDLYLGPMTATLGLVGGIGTKSFSYTDALSIYTFGRGNPGLVAPHPLLANNTTYFYNYTNKMEMLENLRDDLASYIGRRIEVES